MEYSTSLLIEAIVQYSNWFVLYLILYSIVGLFVIGNIGAIVSGFFCMMKEKNLFLFILAIFILIAAFPRPNLFGFVEVKGQYVIPIKEHIHSTQIENLHSREITDLIKYQFNDNDVFYLNFKKEIAHHIPKNVEINMRDLDDALYSDYKQCFISKNKPQHGGDMKIDQIYDEIKIDKVNCARKAVTLFMQPLKVENFIKNL